MKDNNAIKMMIVCATLLTAILILRVNMAISSELILTALVLCLLNLIYLIYKNQGAQQPPEKGPEIRNSPLRHSDSLLRSSSVTSKNSFRLGLLPTPQKNNDLFTKVVNWFKTIQLTNNERQNSQKSLFEPLRPDRSKPKESQELGPNLYRPSDIDYTYRFTNPTGNRKSLNSFTPPSSFDQDKKAAVRAILNRDPIQERTGTMSQSGFGRPKNDQYADHYPPLGKNYNRNATGHGFYDDFVGFDERRPKEDSKGIFSSIIEERERDARKTLEMIGMPQITISEWKDNVIRWLATTLIPRIITVNRNNILNINLKLKYFGKRLFEAELLKGPSDKQSDPFEIYSDLNTIKIDEVLNYGASLRSGGPQWNLALQLKPQEARALQKEFEEDIEERLHLERYFEIEGYKTVDIRLYVMEKLYSYADHFYKHFDYVVGELSGKYPSDLQIISNMFFNFLASETLTEVERSNNFLNKKIVYGYRDVIDISRADPQEVCFKQCNPSVFEPHYDIYSGKEHWAIIPKKTQRERSHDTPTQLIKLIRDVLTNVS